MSSAARSSGYRVAGPARARIGAGRDCCRCWVSSRSTPPSPDRRQRVAAVLGLRPRAALSALTAAGAANAAAAIKRARISKDDRRAMRMALLPPQQLPVSSTAGALSRRVPRPQSYRPRGRTSTRPPAIRAGPVPRTLRPPARRPASRTRRRCQRVLPVLLIRPSLDLLPRRSARPVASPAAPPIRRPPSRSVSGSAMIELILPHRGERPPQMAVRIEAGLDRRDHHAIGKPRVERPVSRLQMKFEPALSRQRCSSTMR